MQTDANSYLLEIRNKYYRLSVIESEIAELRDLSQRAGAMDYSNEHVQGGEEVKEPAFIKALDKIEDKIGKYEEILTDYQDYRNEALDRLWMLSDGIDIKVLHLKFFEFKRLEDIAKIMYYSYDAVRYHYRKGLKEFEARKLYSAEHIAERGL